ncbi:MAG: 50S ribosomal protein L2 [Nanoarchaeota archaeon]
MGKNLIQQKRGKGSPTYRAPSFRYIGMAKYPRYGAEVIGTIQDIVHSQGHNCPLLDVEFNDGERCYLQAPEGVKVGDKIIVGENAEIKVGNVLPLKSIPEGTNIFNIESNPGDGGKFVKGSGSYAKVSIKSGQRIMVVLPSNKKREFTPQCRASIGIIAGGGRTDKPFLKAGTKFHKMRAKNKLWPIVSGASMNAVNHPLGGRSSHAKGHQSTISRNAPPGKKAGLIAARRTGRKRRV